MKPGGRPSAVRLHDLLLLRARSFTLASVFCHIMIGNAFSVTLPADSDLSNWMGSARDFAGHPQSAGNFCANDASGSSAAASAQQDACDAAGVHDLAALPSTVPVFALVACQRTGTQVLREVLNTSPAVALLAEPFSVGPEPVYWQNFVRTLPASEFPPRSASDALAILDSYVALIRQDVGRNCEWYGGPKSQLRAIGLDVKYNQVKCANPIVSDLRAQPLLIEYFRERKIPIVHLVRQNVAYTALSMIVANTRKVWHTYDTRPIEGRYRVSPAELIGYMQWIKEEREEFRRITQALTVQTIVYEDLADDLSRINAAGDFPQDTRVLSRLAALLDVPNHFRNDRQMCKVINKPYAEILENCDELVAALETSEFSEFAQTLSPAPESAALRG